MTGTLSAQLRRMPDTPAPIEMPHIQEAIISPDTWATSAAWKKITAGPEYEISTARNPAAMADTDQSRLSVGFPQISVFSVPAGFCMTILWQEFALGREASSRHGGTEEAEQVPVDAVGLLDRQDVRSIRQDHEFRASDVSADVLHQYYRRCQIISPGDDKGRCVIGPISCRRSMSRMTRQQAA